MSPRRATKSPRSTASVSPRPCAADAEKHFARGIFLKGENKRTRPAQIERLSPTEVRITLIDGRYHQVKRMFAALANRVVRLHRESIGRVMLDPALTPGASRALTEGEIAGLHEGCDGRGHPADRQRGSPPRVLLDAFFLPSGERPGAAGKVATAGPGRL